MQDTMKLKMLKTNLLIIKIFHRFALVKQKKNEQKNKTQFCTL